jgi:hypothetical protein
VSDLCWQLALPPAGITPNPARSPAEDRSAQRGALDRSLLAARTREAFAERTGTEIGDQQALALAERIIAGRVVRNPAAYVVAAIARDVDPFRLLPGGASGTESDAALLQLLKGRMAP